MSALKQLQDWYRARCDGDWEHRHGVRIESLDNPGWLVRIDLSGTELEGAHFEPVRVDASAGGWVDMRIENGGWQAACDTHGLETALEAFFEWARSAAPTEPERA